MSKPSDAGPGHYGHVGWSRSANIYEVNLRQFTPEGTFSAFAGHLPRLKKMGVDILWLMPIQPVGRKERKGTLGSYYSVSDYLAVNPEFGTLDDFKQLVTRIHALGLRVIIDWVANHTAWDHGWVTQHPDWYKKNAQGQIGSYEYFNGHAMEYWTDVVGLDYQQSALWPAMTDALAFWVRETDIDGFRCDVAGLVPLPFWQQARAVLDAIKPVFMLAEDAGVAMHDQAFDMTYDWDLLDVLLRISAGKGDVNDLVSWLDRRTSGYPQDALRMTFTTNHDKNSWEGHDVERFGDAFGVAAVLAATLPGLPLIYGGQESVLDKRLAFFEKDAIDWKTYPRADFYAGLLALKHDNPALWNGAAGAELELLGASSTSVFAFRRCSGTNTVTVLANLSATPQTVPRDGQAGQAATVMLPAWGWWINTAAA